MTLNQFVGEFILCKNEDAKKALVKAHITTDYLPYTHKMTVCNSIIQIADYKEIPLPDGTTKKYFAPNTAQRYFLFILQLIKDYTDIICVSNDIDTTDDAAVASAMMNAFDRFEHAGVTPILIEMLGDEYTSLHTVLDMRVNDTAFIESSLPSYLDTKIDTISLVANQLQTMIAESHDN